MNKYYNNRRFPFSCIFEIENLYIIGTTLAVDKHTKVIRPLDSSEASIIFPNTKNTYKGVAWKADSKGAEWYDIETLLHGNVSFNLPTDFKINREKTDIPHGKLIVYGTRYVDGKNVIYFVDIETGNYTCTESESDRPTTALIPLN